MALDTDPGIGVGAPITTTTDTTTFQPPVRTALPLAEYAHIIGINPVQFMAGSAPTLFPTTGCTDRWRQYAWQDEAKVSRDELAREIKQAEIDIASELGYYPGLIWKEGESILYPKYYKRKWTTVSGMNIAGFQKTIMLPKGKFVSAGQRSMELIGTASRSGGTIVLIDEDSDSFYETAQITLPTTKSSIYAHKVYYEGRDGHEQWEIRPVLSKTITGGSIIIKLPVWLLFLPEKLAAFPGPNGYTDLDPSDTNDLVDSVDVYYETADPATECTLYWYENDETTPTTQTAHVEGKNPPPGEVSITPASYDAVTGEFTIQPFTEYREPDRVEVSYLSGDFVLDTNRGEHIVPPDLAKAIAWLATARLSRPLCTQCQNVKDKEKRLSTDLSFQTRGESGDLHFVPLEVLTCPFGTRIGEVEAWRIVKARIRDGDVLADVALI